jgi:hypothetical protein
MKIQMKKYQRSITALVIGSLFTLTTGAALVRAEDNKPAPPPAQEQPDKVELFSGKIDELNVEAKSFKVAKQTYLITEKTKLLNKDKEIKLEDLKVGTEIHGLAKKNADGKLVATIVKVGVKPHEESHARLPKI